MTHPFGASNPSPVMGPFLFSLLAITLVSSSAHAAEPVATAPKQAHQIAWTQQQATDAGVVTTVISAHAASSAGLVLQGTVMILPESTQVVSAVVSAVVQEVLVATGQVVRAGQPIARLMSPQLLEWQRDLMLAENQADAMGTRLQRDERLFAEGIIPESRVQDVRSQTRLAQVSASERRQALRLAGAGESKAALSPYLTLAAASAGTVLEVLASPGQRLEAGMPVARLARNGKLMIELQASPSQAASLKPGSAFLVDGCKAPGRLIGLAPQVSASNQAVLVRVAFNSTEPCLRIGQFVQTTAAGTGPGEKPVSGDVFNLPASAVVRQDGQPYAFVKTPKGFTATRLELAAGSGDHWTVRSGLKAGDEVATRGLAALKGAWLGLGGESK